MWNSRTALRQCHCHHDISQAPVDSPISTLCLFLWFFRWTHQLGLQYDTSML